MEAALASLSLSLYHGPGSHCSVQLSCSCQAGAEAEGEDGGVDGPSHWGNLSSGGLLSLVLMEVGEEKDLLLGLGPSGNLEG